MRAILGTMAKSQKIAQEIALPPQVPETLTELDRAVALLGIVAKEQPLKKSRRDELKALLGAFPQPETAAAWKTQLKQVREEYI